MTSDRDTLAEAVNAAIESWPNRAWLVLPGPTDIGSELAGHFAKELAGWRPPAHVITTAAEADALPIGTILFHVDCPDPDPCIWRRACSPSEVEDEIDGGTFDHIHWAAWGDGEERYDGADLEGHADCGGPLLAVYVPTEEARDVEQ
ncbi:hypothetical protein IU487_22185 [Nocardia puris]|uniref:hypothetical protein n=1 Tax=Nocardia puris TaxID=208602 RepID=UPI00189466E8|nr:hypothetical protein [Nocardia puris]MBF6213729.1 hypothetical protein [Nocardia puris]